MHPNERDQHTEEEIRCLCKGLPVKLKNGPSGLTVRTEFFDRRRNDDLGAFILGIQNETGQFGLAWLTIYRKQDYDDDFKIEAKSAVLWDMQIRVEEWLGKGVGSEWLEFMKEYARSRGAERFYAWYVQPEAERFFAKNGFVRTDVDPDWWIMKVF